MKKGIVFLLLISMMGILISCKSEEQKDDSSSVNNSQTEIATTTSASSEKLSVQVPNDWQPVEGSVLEYQYMKNTTSFMIKKENFSATTLEGVVSEVKDIFKNSFDNYQDVNATENIKIGGKDAVKFIFTCEVSGLQMKYMYVYVFVGTDTYAITFGDQQSTFDNLLGDYETILNAITIN